MVYHVEHCGIESVNTKLNELSSQGWTLSKLIPMLPSNILIVVQKETEKMYVSNRCDPVSEIQVAHFGPENAPKKVGGFTWPWRR